MDDSGTAYKAPKGTKENSLILLIQCINCLLFPSSSLEGNQMMTLNLDLWYTKNISKKASMVGEHSWISGC